MLALDVRRDHDMLLEHGHFCILDASTAMQSQVVVLYQDFCRQCPSPRGRLQHARKNDDPACQVIVLV